MSIERGYGKRSSQHYENTGGGGCKAFEARGARIEAIVLEQKYSDSHGAGCFARPFVSLQDSSEVRCGQAS